MNDPRCNGFVHQARDTELERDVAIKILPDELAENELRILDRITGTITPAGSAPGRNVNLSRDGRWYYVNLGDQRAGIWMLDFCDMAPGPGNDALTDPSP